MLVVPLLDDTGLEAVRSRAAVIILTSANGQPHTRVWLWHSGHHLFVRPRLGQDEELSLAVDPTASTSQSTLIVRLGSDGSASAMLRDEQGQLAPAQDAVLVDLSPGHDLALPLALVGGYGRVVRGAAIIEQHADGAQLAAWPAQASLAAPDGWEEVELSPSYRAGLSAGSVILDLDGSLVVPGLPALGEQLTVEAWVDPEPGGLIFAGDGPLALTLDVSERATLDLVDGRAALQGQLATSPGWHHLAASVGADGRRSLFVDGVLDVSDAPARSPGGWPGAQARGGDLRIGSGYAGYLRGLRLWSEPRSRDELRAGAFVRLDGQTPGLVASLPFEDGLGDDAGGLRAGLCGSAALARAAPSSASFALEPSLSPLPVEPPAPEPAWDAQIPFSGETFTLDGIGKASVWKVAVRLRLEPDRNTYAASLRLAPDGLYLCTNVVFGDATTTSSVTLWLSAETDDASVPGPAHLRITLAPAAAAIVAVGDGESFAAPGPPVESAQSSADRFAIQDDIVEIDTPWWCAELRVPLEALGIFAPGSPLRLALRYAAAVPAHPGAAASDVPLEDGQVVRTWPESFSGDQPSTWGLVTTEAAS